MLGGSESGQSGKLIFVRLEGHVRCSTSVVVRPRAQLGAIARGHGRGVDAVCCIGVMGIPGIVRILRVYDGTRLLAWAYCGSRAILDRARIRRVWGEGVWALRAEEGDSATSLALRGSRELYPAC